VFAGPVRKRQALLLVTVSSASIAAAASKLNNSLYHTMQPQPQTQPLVQWLHKLSKPIPLQHHIT
jgi:hypothetical protein